MNYSGRMWNILVNYALEHNSYRTKTTASNFETAVNIASQLDIEVKYTVSLNGAIKSLSFAIDGMILHKTFN